ncbi:hypothetical protein AXX12_02270 [Anaerosporomusa subterranea]|uniref:Glutamate decarboxylase n=1 Tax=Anaerosporomusa subterranea TaxID=1794912 RepID=A0A154BSU3_ANASB|nr:hypothetical protein [Anaerosporomusa subterranea]KYZ76989.1 hypothetical protein AXX12_02270 [Anaerosporomusa subterranea]
MWTVIYIAAGRSQADKIRSTLLEGGVLADARPVGMSLSGDGLFEILVLESEAEEANLILCRHTIT